MSDERKPETLAAQALGWVDETTRAVSPPIHPSTTFERAADGSYPGGRSYTRDKSPAYDQAEELLAALEGGEQALLYASGMAAATAVFEALDRGAHVVAPRQMYWSLRRWIVAAGESGRLDVSWVASGDLGALDAALRRGETRLVWVETPANPTGEITDLVEAAALAHRAGALVAADSTVATPVHTRPIEHGCDLVMHSATKTLNGHSDVLAGALVAASTGSDLWTRIVDQRSPRGAMLGPFEAWLLLRGMRTLVLRARAASAGALAVAEWLENRAGVSRVFYPGLASHPGHAIAARQMAGGFGCVVSFCVEGGEERARAVAAGTRIFKQATSLGGVESLIEHRPSVEKGSDLPRELIRLSVGIEAPEDLIADLERALR